MIREQSLFVSVLTMTETKTKRFDRFLTKFRPLVFGCKMSNELVNGASNGGHFKI